jgi:hypothetical protein
MIVYTGNSSWGIKDSGKDISADIISIVNRATDFIVAGGYNFNFRNGVGATFFAALQAKAAAGIPVLMLMPPSLAGSYNPMPAIINNLVSANIAVIINRHNHSKWILSNKDLYYGSCNFTPTSWKDRIEVITFHHDLLTIAWKRRTVNDFYQFLRTEINRFTTGSRSVKKYPALVTATVNNWIRLKPLIKKFNPSVERVRETLQNIEAAELILLSVMESWLLQFDSSTVDRIYAMCHEIWATIANLADYGYGHIYNEVQNQQTIDDQRIVTGYNDRHRRFVETVDRCIIQLQEGEQTAAELNGLKNKNDILVAAFLSSIEQNLGPLLGENDDFE